MKYKLIKIFPGSPELGYISKTKDSDVLNGHYWMGQWFNPKDYPEFWEEVVEVPEYVKCVKQLGYCIVGKVYKTRPILKTNFEWKYEKSTCTDPHIVDDVDSGWDYGGNINYIMGYFTISTKEEYDAQFKVKLFTTEDGVDIFEGNKYWFCRKNAFEGSNIIENIAKKGSDCGSNGRDYYYFSTRQAAKEYIAKNKILFVTEDGVGIKKTNTYWFINHWEIREAHAEETPDFYKDKTKRFSTKEKAQAYIDLNKPVYSKQQIINILKGFDAEINDFHSGSNDDYEPYIKEYK